MKRPKITIAWDPWDWAMEITGALFVVLMIGLPSFYFNELPEMIPRHFNASGEPDAFSGKGVIWTMPIVGLVMYWGMFILNRYPHVLNYPTKITEENAERQYRNATKLVRALNLIIAAGFFYIVFATIETALERQSGLGGFFMPVFLVAIFGLLGVYLFRALRS